MKLSQDFIGVSLSHGTLRAEDLIEALESFLVTVCPDFEPIQVDPTTEDASWYINEDLFNKLNEIAPEGTYFSSHPGDSSAFGFWSFEDDE